MKDAFAAIRGDTAMLLAALALLWTAAGCDLVDTEAPPRLVMEGYLHPDRPAPNLRLSQTGGLDEPYPSEDPGVAATQADVELMIGGVRVAYRESTERPGTYEPMGESTSPAGEAFRLEAHWNGQEAIASGAIPPAVHLDSVHVTTTDEAVRAVFVDSLFLDPIVFDSLRADADPPGTPEYGWAYPVEVTLWWQAAPEPSGPEHWVHLRLRPEVPDGSALDDFFLRSEQIKPERDAECDAAGASCSSTSTRVWTGVYGIPVEREDASMPVHRLEVAIIRSGADYAHFASTRGDPDRREPVSNVEGGLGIVAGIALDSLSVMIE